MSDYWIWIMILGIVLLGLLYLTWYLLAHYILNPTGKGAYKKTASVLKKFALLRQFRVITGIKLTVDGKSVPVENILIGYFGILMVHTLGARGAYFGTLDGESWSVVRDEKKTPFPNPHRQMEEAAVLLRSAFAREKLYNIPIEHIIVMTNRSGKTELYITNDGLILLPGKLKGYLNKTKFEKDIGLDVEKVAGVIRKNSEEMKL